MSKLFFPASDFDELQNWEQYFRHDIVRFSVRVWLMSRKLTSIIPYSEGFRDKLI